LAFGIGGGGGSVSHSSLNINQNNIVTLRGLAGGLIGYSSGDICGLGQACEQQQRNGENSESQAHTHLH
jgi:hypothetical protein